MPKKILAMCFAFLLLSLNIVACSSTGDAVDGDGTDGDAADGDEQPDGDAGDGDAEPIDGDGEMEEDGDAVDGDRLDGDVEVDTDGEADLPFQYPDPSFIHEIRTPPSSLVDENYSQELNERYRSDDVLGDRDVYSLRHIGDTTYAGTAAGVYKKGDDEAQFSKLFTPVRDALSVIAIARTPVNDGLEDYLAVAGTNMVLLLQIDGGGQIDISFATATISSIAVKGGKVMIGTPVGIFETTISKKRGVDFSQVDGTDDLNVSSLTFSGDMLLVGTDAGVLLLDPLSKRRDTQTWTSASGDLLDDDVRDIAVCGQRTVIASAEGIAVHDGDTVILREAGLEGLPTDDLLAVDCNAEGILIGHAVGATWLAADFSHTDHYHSGRWMPSISWPWNGSEATYHADNRVRAVALDGADRWIATHLGLSRIYLLEQTLADKEQVFDAYVDSFWRMDGFFSSDGYISPTPFDDLSTNSLHDKDNDGLWTEMMIGGWCFAYAATGKEKYYQYARKAMDNMFKLIDYPAITFEALGKSRGFIARSIVSEDEGNVYQSKVDQAEKVGGKDILRWNPVTVEGKNYLWKADTSSDEYAGHWFGMPIFYDLCAKTDEEREEVARYAAEAMDYIIEGEFLLLDLDGTRTGHGHWNPDTISIAVDGVSECFANGYDLGDCFSAEGGGGWLNSIEVLGGLLGAWHMTGDEKYFDAYNSLIVDHRYNEVAMASEKTMTIVSPSIANHSDHELAMLAYTSLIRYEPNDDRRAKWIESLEFLYKYELPERNPWWAAVCALSGCADPEADAASSIRTLREIPDDLRQWLVDSYHRKDMTIIGGDRFDDDQIDAAFPYDENRTMWWNGNPYNIRDGGSGNSLAAPTVWLLPYYMNLYSGLLTQPGK